MFLKKETRFRTFVLVVLMFLPITICLADNQVRSTLWNIWFSKKEDTIIVYEVSQSAWSELIFNQYQRVEPTSSANPFNGVPIEKRI